VSSTKSQDGYATNPKIAHAEGSRDGVLVEFDDGRAAFYPASLLAEVFSQAIKLEELDSDET
jgi:hypothetical protein